MNKPNLRIPTFAVKCPNHGCPLEGCGFPLPKQGTGICPISKCPFDFKVDIDESKMVKDKDGKLVPTVGWNITGND